MVITSLNEHTGVKRGDSYGAGHRDVEKASNRHGSGIQSHD